MFKVVRKSEAVVRKIANNKTATNYITKDISPLVSFAITEATDYYEKETAPYDRIFYVLEGKLLLVFDGKEIPLNSGGCCFIKKNTIYEMKGTFKAVVINQPAFGTH
jgi:ethanolamine utilization protein EutQ (cupin superfamily)